MIETDILVVGAGPAGLAAAAEASSAGARVLLIDEGARMGGQYYRQPPTAFMSNSSLARDKDHLFGVNLIRQIENSQVELLTSTTVWGVDDPDTLVVLHQGACKHVRAARIIVSTGAYDRPVAFPGWELPGVITAGAAQTLIKGQWVRPGDRVLMVGSGPFQLPVADQLVKAGATVVGVLEAVRIGKWFAKELFLGMHVQKLQEGISFGHSLLKSRVPYMLGWTILEATGSGGVEQAVITRVDDMWRPIAGTERRLDVDTICTAFGFVPSLQLPRLLGCRISWHNHLATWVTDHDQDQRTSIHKIFVAGETTGIAGHEAALEEGVIAGAAAAADLGASRSPKAEQRIAKTRERLRHHREFSAYLNRTFAIRPGIYELIRDDTLICRCEEVTAGQVRAAARDGGADLRSIKQLTRVGMGRCQGRMCASNVAHLASLETGTPIERVALDTSRLPIKPVRLGALADMTA